MPDTAAAGRRWSVYLIRCRDGSLYTGIAIDVARRLEAHRNNGRGAKYLRGRAPLELAGHWPIGNRSLATQVENRIKRMTRSGKEALIARPGRIAAVLKALPRTAAADRDRRREAKLPSG